MCAVIATVLVALTGHWVTQHANRRERRSKVYAEALEALARYQELPYRILRRENDSGSTRAEMSRAVSDAQASLEYYRTLLRVESPEVGSAYARLVATTKREGGPFRDEAWTAPAMSSDTQMIRHRV